MDEALGALGVNRPYIHRGGRWSLLHQLIIIIHSLNAHSLGCLHSSVSSAHIAYAESTLMAVDDAA